MGGIESWDRTVIVTGAETYLDVRFSREKGACATVLECDVGIPKHHQRLIEVALEPPGKLFGLENDAAIFRFRPLFEERLADWRDTSETHLEVAFFCQNSRSSEMQGAGRSDCEHYFHPRASWACTI
jgi:NAD(P)-dependent dehydrogenase (short-subunit alcohol dehydrogenase family)